MKWNPYPETEPEPNAPYIVWDELRDCWYESVFNEDGTWDDVGDMTIDVTHWMKIEPPTT